MKNLFLKACVKADLAMDNVADCILNKLSPRAKTNVTRISQGLILGGLTALVVNDLSLVLSASDVGNSLVANMAFANGEYKGLGNIAQTAIQGTAVPIVEGGKYVAYGCGLFGVGSGLNKFVQMSKQQSQTSAKEAFAHLGAGAGLLGLGTIADNALESLTGNSDSKDTGKLVTN